MADTSALEDPLADRGPELSGTTTALLVLATTFVGLRFWARWTVGFQYGLDDWFIVVGLVRLRFLGSELETRLTWPH